jgi:CubicO group peptidase (beta-lactamase class C family)
MENRLHNRLQSLLKSFVENGPAGCSLAVMHQGKNVFQDYVGYAEQETQTPIKEDTIFRIYSMTKVVTCTAALMLYERGLFLLNDPLENYLPEFKNPQVYRIDGQGGVYASPAKSSILVKDLFTMTSGLTYPGNGNETERQLVKELNSLKENGEKLTLRRLSQVLASVPLAFDPGAQWRYGYSHDVLAAFVEVVSGKKFSEFLQEEIFGPLRMVDTGFTISEEKKHRLAAMYNRLEDGKLIKNEHMDEHYQVDSVFESGGGGLLSTLGDYSRFACMLANAGEFEGTKIIGKHTINLMTTNHLNPEQMANYNWDYLAGYGYGLGVRTMMDQAKGGINGSIGEFGWSGLAGTWVLVDLKEKLSAVYMQQMLPNFEAYHQPRLRNVIYGTL